MIALLWKSGNNSNQPKRATTMNIAILNKLTNQETTIKQIKQGEMFRFIDRENAPVWVRGSYDRESGKYSCIKYADMNHETFKLGSCIVFVGFTF